MNSPGSEIAEPQLTRPQGYLLKKSTAGEWQRRYFETNGQFLTYYKSNKKAKLLAALSLPQVGEIKLVGDVNDTKGDGAIFQLDLKDRQYVLRAPSLEEANTWVSVLINLRDGASMDSKSGESTPVKIGSIGGDEDANDVDNNISEVYGTQRERKSVGEWLKQSNNIAGDGDSCCVIS
jgi:hypothetical protein